MKNWKEMLSEAMKRRDETFSDIEENTMTEEEMNREFDTDYGAVEGCPFTVWTKNTVYFPICYDGAESVGMVSRNPDGKATNHQGGG